MDLSSLVVTTVVPAVSGPARLATPHHRLPQTPDAGAAVAGLESEARSRVLRDAILALEAPQRVVLSLHYVEGLTPREIATVLGVTKARIGRMLRQALRTLRDAQPAPLGATA